MEDRVGDPASEKEDFQADEEQDGEDEVRIDTGEEGTLLARDERGNGGGGGETHGEMIAYALPGSTLYFLARGWNWRCAFCKLLVSTWV